MQYKTIAISAFAATAFAQQSTPTEDVVSIFSVLQTALPSSLVAEALTNSDAVSSQIASQFLAGETPSWFQELPSDIQTYIVPVAPVTTGVVDLGNGTTTNATIISSMTGNSTGNATAGTTTTRSSNTITTNTASSTDDSDSSSGSGGSGSDSSDSASESSESGNAAPTAFIGAGLAGAVGLVGLLAL